jgi:hypothetical protein
MGKKPVKADRMTKKLAQAIGVLAVEYVTANFRLDNPSTLKVTAIRRLLSRFYAVDLEWLDGYLGADGGTSSCFVVSKTISITLQREN